jgi:hypothetical protein
MREYIQKQITLVCVYYFFKVSMKKIIFAILFLSLHVASFAIKTEDMYIMRHTTKGQLFFISENIFPSTDRTFELPFDITYLNSTDSVSIKMTVPSNTLTHVDSVALVQSGSRYVCPMAHSIYKEKDKKHWVHRCDCAFSYTATKMCLIHPTPPQIVVYTTTGTHTYAMPQQQWQKLVPHLQEIFMLIDASKR